MRETRKSLKAENTQIRSQLAVHNHATRKSLHEYIGMVEGRNAQLIEEYKKLETAYNGLQSMVQATAKPAQETV